MYVSAAAAAGCHTRTVSQQWSLVSQRNRTHHPLPWKIVVILCNCTIAARRRSTVALRVGLHSVRFKSVDRRNGPLFRIVDNRHVDRCRRCKSSKNVTECKNDIYILIYYLLRKRGIWWGNKKRCTLLLHRASFQHFIHLCTVVTCTCV